MKTKIEFNIGMENNPFSVHLTIELLAELFENYNLMLRMEHGKWRGEEEPTIIGRLDCKNCLTQFLHTFTSLACTLNQDCIALRADTGDNVLGELVWSHTYEGEKDIEFDEQYFIRFKG